MSLPTNSLPTTSGLKLPATTLGVAAVLGVAVLLMAAAAPAVAASVPALASIAGGEPAATEVRYRRGGGAYYGGYGYGGYGYYRPPVYLYAGPPVVYQTYSGGGHCAWLRRKARETGSRHWWNRYRREC